MIDTKRRVRDFREPPSPVLSLPTQAPDSCEQSGSWLGKGVSFFLHGVTVLGFGARLGLFR